MMSSYLNEFMWRVMVGQLQQLCVACAEMLLSGILCDWFLLSKFPHFNSIISRSVASDLVNNLGVCTPNGHAYIVTRIYDSRSRVECFPVFLSL